MPVVKTFQEKRVNFQSLLSKHIQLKIKVFFSSTPLIFLYCQSYIPNGRRMSDWSDSKWEGGSFKEMALISFRNFNNLKLSDVGNGKGGVGMGVLIDILTGFGRVVLFGGRLALLSPVFVAVLVSSALASVRVVREVQADVHGLVLPSLCVMPWKIRNQLSTISMVWFSSVIELPAIAMLSLPLHILYSMAWIH